MRNPVQDVYQPFFNKLRLRHINLKDVCKIKFQLGVTLMAFGVVKDQSTFHPTIFPSATILLILITFSLDVVLILLGEI